MLLNTWLTAARRQFLSASSRRVNRTGERRSIRIEALEERAMLAGAPVVINALVINPDNQSQYSNAAGGIVVTSANLAGKDALVIEGISISSTSGDGISVDLSGISLKRLAIESVTITQYTALGLNLDLTNVTGLDSVAIEDVTITGAGRAVDLTFTNTDTNALTIDDSVLPGVMVSALGGSDIRNGVVTENRISSGSGIEGIILNVVSTPGNVSTANDFQIVNNLQISTLNRDAVQVNATGYVDSGTQNTVSELDGLTISNNTIGTAEGANVLFRAQGDTFVQPFVLTNNSNQGELLQTFVFDLSGIGMQFDIDPVTGKPFTSVANSGAITGLATSTLSNNNQVLTVTFTDFNPGETLQFLIDIDLAGGIPASVFGQQLIGADVQINFSGNKTVAGQMAGDPNSVSASQFLVGAGVAGSNHGIHINATALPLANLRITSNVVTGAPGHGLFLDARTYSDISGEITGNRFASSGRDGIRVGMVGSNFYGTIDSNTIANNGGYGISLLPEASRSGFVQSATNGRPGNPIIITSANHNLQTGEEVILQGLVNDDKTVSHPGNGRFTVTRLSNNTFSLQGTSVLVSGALYTGGGAWYVPDFRNGGTNADSARGFVQIDLQAGAVPRAITNATNTPEVDVTSAAHGLKTGDRIRITGVQGNTAANGTFAVAVISPNVFRLKGVAGNGTYTIAGTWVPLTDTTPQGDVVSTGIISNSITGNKLAGIYSDVAVGTTVRADIVRNIVSLNEAKGIHFESHSYGLGTSLPLNPNDPAALPGIQDLGFDVKIGTESNGSGNTSGGGNTLHQNNDAGIAIELLDYGTGGVEIWSNTITSTQDDGLATTPYSGEGIYVRLDNARSNSDAVAVLARSLIKKNVIGVDNLGNEGNGLYFVMTQRTKIQILDVVDNTFLNSGRDGFHFERSEDASLSGVKFEKNRATNNTGDGFDLFTKNTVKNRQDFRINDNFIEDNGQYGLRIDVQADARIEVQFNNNSVKRNGHTPAGTGFHPNDGVAGSAGAAGGVGIHAFQQAEVVFTADNTKISDNIGDGFSVDAFFYFDTLDLTATFTNTELNGNTRTGFRSHGATFGNFDWFNTQFNDNGEDGARIVSIEDKTDFFRRRVGGMDIDIVSLRSSFDRNQQSGLQLGQGTNAQLGDGTALNANSFSDNIAEDGLKITQSSGPYLEESGRRRTITANNNYFIGNGDDGIDIGHFTVQEAMTQIQILSNGQRNGSAADGEPGNPEHGDEVVTDVFVSISDAEIISNRGNGVEFLGDSINRVPAVTGGGQDIPYDFNSGLTIRDSRIAQNARRGIDILNRVQHDSFINIIENDIVSNGYEGIYVVNTASHFQRQNGPGDPLDSYLEIFQNGETAINPNIELRVQDNLIESNGTAAVTSTVPINSSNSANDDDLVPHRDHTHNFTQIQGTLGGLVIRVGTADSSFRPRIADTPFELGLSGVDAEIWRNSFDGNFGADVYFDNFVSQISPQARDIFTNGNPRFRWNVGYRDPLSRFDLSFRENDGNSLDVVNGFAFYDNWEGLFKSRLSNTQLDPNGHFIDPYRQRNGTRTVGFQFFNDIGVDPAFLDFLNNDGTIWGPWSYDGLGTTTWRVESDFDFNQFALTNSTLGFSNFYDEVNLGGFGELQYQWDTGVDTPSFNGRSTYSLDRGDIFNVQASDPTPIQPDRFEDNDGFVSAKLLATDNPLTSVVETVVAGIQTFTNLTIETKADRDYYAFTAAADGALSVSVNVLDTLGANLQFMIYEVDPDADTEETLLFTLPDGTANYRNVAPGSLGTLSTTVVAGREYIIEVLSDEFENIGDDGTVGKPFRYGTTRNYSLMVNAPPFPAAPGGGGGGGGTGSGSDGSSSGSGSSSGGGGGGGSQSGSGGSLPGTPVVQFVGPVSPDPRSVSAGSVIVRFNEDVSGVDILDFTLTRNGVPVSLTGVTLTQLTPSQYALDLTGMTGESGNYVLTLVAAGSGISDTDNSPLTTGGSDSWIVSNSITSVLDAPDTNPGDGLAADITGVRTLRAAVMESNTLPGSDVIVLGAATYLLTIGGRFEDQGVRGDLDVRGNLTIRGVDARSTIIDAALLDRVFHVFPGAKLTLENLTIRGGSAFDGAGVFNQGTLVLNNVNVIGNLADNQGGGIFNAGILTSVGSAISENIAGSRGGAVNNIGTASYLNTTISTNYAVSRGGGLFNEGAAGSTLINVTIAANESGSRGGGLASESSVSTRIGNSILERNVTDAIVPVSLASTGRDMSGGVQSLGFNVIQNLDSRFSTGTSAGLLTSDKFGRDSSPYPDLSDVLQYGQGNGVGFHALKPAGGAVDAGSNALYPVTPIVGQQDAIGNPRLIDGNGDGAHIIDLGAVEHLVNTPSANFIANPNPAGLNEEISFDGRASAHPNSAIGSIVKWEWDFDWNPANLPPSLPLTDPNYDPTEYFAKDAEGSVSAHTYTDPLRTMYTVRLIVTDNFGNKGFVDKTVVVGVPTKPVIQRPFTVTSDLTPEIRWQASPATYRMQLFLVNVTNGSRIEVLNVSNLSTTSYTPTSNLAPGRYEVIVTASNTSGSTASNSYFFDVKRLALTSPQGSIFDITPKFTWVGIPGSSRYDLWVNRNQPSYIDQVIRREFIPGNETTFQSTTSLGLGTFTWWVRAYDADGVAGDWSISKAFTITRPAFTAPAIVTLDTTPTLTWTDLGAPRYELWVNKVGGPTRIIYQPALPTNTFTPTTPLPNGDYEAWVRPLAADGEAGLWSLKYSFRMDYRIGPVTISPIGITTDTTPTFTWQPIEGAEKYDLWVDNLSTGVTQVIRVDVLHVANATTLTYTRPAALPAGNYRWWVRAVSPTGPRTAWSAPVDFTIPVPSIVSPVGPIATNLPKFTWTGVPQYVKYDLWVDNLTTGRKQVLRVEDVMATFYQTVLPLENGMLRAWVRGIDALGNVSQWSSPASFSISTGVGNAPIPLRTTVSNNTPTFFWQSGSNAVTHEILVKRLDQTGQPIVINVRDLPGTSYTATTTLPPGTYRWWIRGLDIDGNGLPWSQPLDFVVDASDSGMDLAPFDPRFSDVVIPTVLVVNSGDWSDEDGVQSITAHPAGTIVQIAPESSGPIEAREFPVVPKEDVTGIDSVMEEWAAAALFIETEVSGTSPLTILPMAPLPTVVSSGSDQDHDAISLLMAGLVAGAVLGGKKKSEEDKRMI